MRRVELTVNNLRIKTKELDEDLAEYIENSLKDGGMSLRADNPAEKLFVAYLKLANRCHNLNSEIENLSNSLEELEK